MLRVRMLGQLDVQLDDRPINLPTRAAQSLLAYLLLNTALHRREQLAGLLWPDSSEANARSYLRHELWRVRKALQSGHSASPDYLLADDLTIGFNAQSDYWLDVAVLQTPATSGVDALSDSLAVYRGELLPGFYDEWVLLEREQLNAVYDQKMQRLLELLLDEQRWLEVIDRAERWIALGRVPEPAYRALLVAHGVRGDMPNVVAVYERCLAALRDELGVAPSPQTRQVYEAILAPDSAGAAQPPAVAVASEPTPVPEDGPPAPGEPPFMGLQYFEEADAALFFGRELLTARLVGRLRQDRFLAIIVGASGSGKSSLVRAGLIPALRRGVPLADGSLPPEGSQDWDVRVMTPTAHPLDALAAELNRDADAPLESGIAFEAGVSFAAAAFAARLAADPHALNVRLQQYSSAPRMLIVVDQFEELFTLCRDDFEREAFIDNLLAAAAPEAEGKALVVITLRADFYGHCAEYPELREALARSQEYIGPMSVDEVRRAIEAPARQAGWSFESGLVDLLLRDAGDEPGALPLLSHALLETWKRRRGRTLTIGGYYESGGVHGALAQTAETTYQQLSAEQQVVARHIFLRLTELGQGAAEGGLASPDTRRRAALDELLSSSGKSDVAQSVLNILAGARLVTLGAVSADVAHEALIREWPTLRQWLAAGREGLQLHRHLTEAAQAWSERMRDPAELYRGTRLAQAREWATANPAELNALEADFLDRSLELARREDDERAAQRERELESARQLAATEQRRAAEANQAAQRLRSRALYLAGAFLLAVLMAGAALALGVQARSNALSAQSNASAAQTASAKAEAARRVATARELAAAAISNLDTDPERSLLLALQAVSTTYSVDQTATTEAANALHRAVLSSRVLLTLSGHANLVTAVAYSPDGAHLLTASFDHTARLWEAATGRLLLALNGHTGSVNGAVFSPDGKWIATASDDQTAIIWDAASGQPLLTLRGDTNALGCLAFSPDAHLVATGGADGTARVWSLASGPAGGALTARIQASFTDDQQPVSGVAFSPDGARLAALDAAGAIRVWNIASGRKLLTIATGGGSQNIVFSPDGARLVMADGTNVKVFDATTGQAVLTLLGHTNVVLAVAYSPDGQRIATGGLDERIKIWDAANGQELFTLAGHNHFVTSLGFSPDGARLVSASSDGSLKVWNLAPEHEWLTLTGASIAVAFSPDGARLAAGNGPAGHVWVLPTLSTGAGDGGLPPAIDLKGHQGDINRVRFSPDGQYLATSSADNTVRIWSLAPPATRGAGSCNVLRIITGFTDKVFGVYDLAFSPDGKQLATTSGADGIQVWTLDLIRQAAITTPIYTLPAQVGDPISVAFSPDGMRLAAGYVNGQVTVFDAGTQKTLLTLSGHTDTVYGLVFSPDGTRIATASRDATARLWDAATGQELLRLAGHTSTVVAIAYSPDGQRVATVSRDGTTNVWDAATGEEQLTLYGDGSGLGGVAFSPDGSRLATASELAVHLYVLPIDDLVRLAHSRLSRALTLDECQKFLHAEQCPN